MKTIINHIAIVNIIYMLSVSSIYCLIYNQMKIILSKWPHKIKRTLCSQHCPPHRIMHHIDLK